jgi:hypothetical protein
MIQIIQNMYYSSLDLKIQVLSLSFESKKQWGCFNLYCVLFGIYN